jgi:hypothetical protein
MMTPFHFGPADRRLFGIFHAAGETAKSDRAVLLCNPFGQEAIRAHRMLRVLAERVVRTGVPVLRFDYFGTGDSPGDDEDADLSVWASDIRTARRELVHRSGRGRIVTVGVRLGGTLAVLAADGPAETHRLVLWDPVLDGQPYLAHLRTKHVESLESTFSLPDPQWRERLRTEPAAFTDQALGFAVTESLRTQIAAVTPRSLTVDSGTEVHLIAHRDDATAAQWAQHLHGLGVAAHHWPLQDAFEWAVGEARNSAIVPAPALARLISSISD